MKFFAQFEFAKLRFFSENWQKMMFFLFFLEIIVELFYTKGLHKLIFFANFAQNSCRCAFTILCIVFF